MNFTKILTFAIIAMFLVTPFACAKQEVADNVKQDKKIDEKVTDKTKEVAKEISNKDKDVRGKVTVTDSDSSKYTVEKKSKTEISVSKDEAEGEHTKAKVTFAKEDLKVIDVDGDGYYGVLHIANDGSASHEVYTESQLTSGVEIVFSENVVNGFSGYEERTYTGVTSGTTLDTPDVSGSDYYITTSVDGSVPTYATGIPTRGLLAHYNFTSNAMDSSGNGKHGTPYYITYTDGGAVFDGVKSNITIPATGINASYTIVCDMKAATESGSYTIISQGKYAWAAPYNAFWLTTLKNQVADADTEGVYQSFTYNSSRITRTYAYNSTHIYGYRNLIKLTSTATPTVPYIGAMENNARIGRYSANAQEFMNGTIYDLIVYNTALNKSEIHQAYAGGSGISFKPKPSYNFTPYNVASGVEKIIDTDATCTGLEYVDTTGGTHTVTVRIYFTEDITKTTETKGAVYQNVSIIHTKQNATASVGTIAYELDPLYSGTPVLSSNNTNATVSRNDTHAIISTGLVKQGQSFSYVVSVADDHDHGIHLNQLMKWVGTGWDFVSTAPEDWDNYIGDQIEVTVS